MEPEFTWEVSPDSDFSIENIPFGVVSKKDSPAARFSASRIGKKLLT